MNNVGTNWDEKCSGCGLCESVCPIRAITIKQKNGFFRPEVSNKCIDCGRCVKFCPGNNSKTVTILNGSNLDNLSDVVQSTHENFTACYANDTKTLISHRNFIYKLYGHSNDVYMRKEAASGAITTELLKYLLESNVVDFIVTAGVYQNDKNLGYSIIDKTNTSQLFKHSGSNYCPTNIGRAIRDIKHNEGKYAIVCLPCLSRGIYNLRKEDEVLNNRVKYVITLLCNHVPSYEATDYILEKYKVKTPKMIKYRGNGWFGYFRAFDDLENGTEIFSIPFSKYYGTKFSEYFWQKACINCIDHFGVYSDSCMGDADFVKYYSDSENDGETIVFSNNPEIIKMIEKMESKGIVSIFRNIEESDLEWIYGPLANKDRAFELNTRSGVKEILREEYLDRRAERVKTFFRLPKRILSRIMRNK